MPGVSTNSARRPSMLPGPRVAFNPVKRPERVRNRAARLLRLLGVRGVMTDKEIAAAMIELDYLGGPREDPPAPVFSEPEAL